MPLINCETKKKKKRHLQNYIPANNVTKLVNLENLVVCPNNLHYIGYYYLFMSVFIFASCITSVVSQVSIVLH